MAPRQCPWTLYGVRGLEIQEGAEHGTGQVVITGHSARVSANQEEKLLCGIFVGGAARRMHGAAKGLLPAPDTGEALVARLARLAEELGWEVVLVGRHPTYMEALPALPALADHPAGVGPIGGLGALAQRRADGHFVALACDMPALDSDLLRSLETWAPDSEAVAPRSADGQRWEPLCARYQGQATRSALETCLARGERSLQAVLREMHVTTLPIRDDQRERLMDWDRPEDLPPGTRT